MVQVENEAGSLGSVRDFSEEANRLFASAVPEVLVKAMKRNPGTWKEVFGPDADEYFSAYSIATYINEVAKAGKAVYPLPMYVNAWLLQRARFGTARRYISQRRTDLQRARYLEGRHARYRPDRPGHLS